MSLIAFLFPISLKEQDREERKKNKKKTDDESDDTTSEVLVISVHQAAGRGADAAAVISSAAPSTGMTPNTVLFSSLWDELYTEGHSKLCFLSLQRQL